MASDMPGMWIESSVASESTRQSHLVSCPAVLSINQPCTSNDFMYFYWFLKDAESKTDTITNMMVMMMVVMMMMMMIPVLIMVVLHCSFVWSLRHWLKILTGGRSAVAQLCLTEFIQVSLTQEKKVGRNPELSLGYGQKKARWKWLWCSPNG